MIYKLIAAVGSRNKGVAEKRDTKALLAKRLGNRVNVALRRGLHKGVGCSKSWKRERREWRRGICNW